EVQGTVEATIVRSQAWDYREIAEADGAFKFVIDFGAIAQAPGEAISDVNQHTEIVAIADIVTLDAHLSLRHKRMHRITSQLAIDLVDGRAESDGDAVVDAVAEGGLQGGHLDLAVQAVIATLERFFIVADHAEGHVQPKTEVPFFIQRSNVVGKGHLRVRCDVTLVDRKSTLL